MKLLEKTYGLLMALIVALAALFNSPLNANSVDNDFNDIIVLRPADPAPFPLDPRLSGIVIAYMNPSLIADQVAPRTPVGQQQFKYLRYNLAEGFTLPDNKVDRKSSPNQVEFSATEVTDQCELYALEDVVPIDDLNNAPQGYDPLGRAVEGIANLNALSREVRTAGLVFTAANYATGNKINLADTSTTQFNNPTTSYPIDVIQAGLDKMVMRGNVMVIGQAAWTKLRSHPQIVAAILGNAGTQGIVSRKQVADLFELDDLLVGQGFINTAKKGQTVSLSRVWGKHIALIARDLLADTTNRVTFALTAQFGAKAAYQWFDQKVGLNGAQIVKAGECVKELITANDLGFFIENAIA
jgi:hypothetical protein